MQQEIESRPPALNPRQGGNGHSQPETLEPGEVERYRSLFNSLGVAFYTTDAEGLITYFNPAAEELWGRSPELNKDAWCGSWRIYHSDGSEMPLATCPMAVTLKENRAVRGAEIVVERPDGERRNVLPYPSPIRDREGRLQGAVNVLVDVTETAQSRKDLEASEQRLQLALRAGGLGAWEWNIETGQITWSPTLEKIHGIPEGSFAGTFEAYQSDVHPDDMQLLNDSITEALQSGTYGITYRIVRPDGKTRHLTASGLVVYSPSGEPVKMTGVCQDVTDRVAAQETDARLVAIVDSTEDAIVGKTLDGIVTNWNAGAVRLYGLEARDILGKHINTIIPEAEWGEEEAVLERVRAGERIEHHEVHRKHKDGRLLDVALSVSPIKDPDDRIIGVSAIHRDITASKRHHELEILLSDVSARLVEASGAFNLPIAVAAVGRLMVPTLADWCAIDLLEEDGTISCVAVIHDDPDHVSTVLELRNRFPMHIDSPQPLAEVIRTGQSAIVDITPELIDEALVDDEATRLTVHGLGLRQAASVPISSRGTVLGALRIAMAESTRRIDAETVEFAEELGRRIGVALDNAALVTKLEDALEWKDEFLALISHELRTPITTIYGGARLLRTRSKTFDDETRGQVLADIEDESDRLFRMVENLLALSRAELGKAQTEPVSLTAVIETLVRTFGSRYPGRPVWADIAPGLPVVDANSVYVEQILRNLISNAVKYSPDGTPIAVRAAVNDGHVAVSVEDEGSGVSEEQAEQLFERFYRSDEAKAKGRGLGLGLTVCKRLVESMDCTIRAVSREPQGFAIVFTLRIHEEERN